MADEKIGLDLDPKKVIDSLRTIGEEAADLAKKIEDSLGKDAVKQIDKLEEKAEKGSNKIASFFSNLGTRVKEDLKTAFDVAGIAGGLKLGKELGSGVKQVFELERAFDRLNTRLHLSNKTLNDFKNSLGRKVSNTGQKLEDVLPGVESAASRGGVKSPEQLASIGEALAKVRASTGENTTDLSETVIEIMKNQGQKITAEGFKKTLDALQGTRTAGAFGSAGEAGHAVESLSPYAKQFKLGTRELGGLAATASQGGAAGQDILKQLLQRASTPGGQQALNSILGQQIFKNGHLDASALGKVNTGRFGQYSQQTMESATGIQGASGADLKRFIEAFKNNMYNFDAVVKGSNETATDFTQATDNLATKVDKFKEKLKESGREVGEGISGMANELLKGNMGGALGKLNGTVSSIGENKAMIGAGVGMTALAGIMLGGGTNSILKKAGGSLGGLAGGLVGGEAAKAAGITPVYVTNAAEIGKSGLGGAIGDTLGKVGPGGAAAASGISGAAVATVAAGAVAAMAGGYALAKAFPESEINKASKDAQGNYKTNMMSREDAAAFRKSIADGMVDGHEKTKTKVTYTNPSTVKGTGGSM